MQIRMKKTTKGSPDGANIVEFVIGRVYEVREGASGDDATSLPQSLAEDFIRDGFAEEVKQSTLRATGSGKPGPSETK